MNEYLDFVKNNVEPWQIGVALLAMAAGKWAFRLLRLVMSFRLLALGAGGAILYPYGKDIQQAFVALDPSMQIASGIAVVCGAVSLFKLRQEVKQPATLSPEAQKVMAALDKFTIEHIVTYLNGGPPDLKNRKGIDDKNAPSRLAYRNDVIYVDGLQLDAIIKCKKERKQVMAHGRAVYDRIVAEHDNKKRQSALDSLNT